MSRAALAKSRAEKGKPLSSATPAVAHEIIPGKYTDQDWNWVLDHDDGDEYVADIIEEACSSAMDIIFQNYIQKQLIPYTVLQAKDAILQIIEWQFLSRDEGEIDISSDEGWVEDEEPEPALTDCWAQGSVPKQHIRGDTPTILEVPEITEDESKIEAQVENVEPVEENIPLEEEATTSIAIDEIEEEDAPTPPPVMKDTRKKGKHKQSYKPHTGAVKSDLSRMTESLEHTEMMMQMSESTPPAIQSPDPVSIQMPASCHSMLKSTPDSESMLQAGRPPGNREVMFDEQGNVILVTKIDPEKLPSHRVKTGFHVVDPAVEAAQARLEAMRTGRYVGGVKKPQPPSSPRTAGVRSEAFTSRTYTITKGASRSTAHTSKTSSNTDTTVLPPPLIETMEVSPGVLVREGERVKKGPRQHPRKNDLIMAALQRGLRPIQVKANVPSLAVAEILEHQTPVVKPIIDNVPVPPIRNSSVASQ